MGSATSVRNPLEALSVNAVLADDHWLGRKRVARLMRAAGLKGLLSPPKFLATTAKNA